MRQLPLTSVKASKSQLSRCVRGVQPSVASAVTYSKDAKAATLHPPGGQPGGKLVSISVCASCEVLKLPTSPTGVVPCENTTSSTRLVWKVKVAKPFLCFARQGKFTEAPGV